MNLFALILFVSFAGFALADDPNGNDFVDSIVSALKAQKNFDPMIMPPTNLNISRKLSAIGFHGTADVKDTKIIGLSNARRIGNATLVNNGTFSAKLHLGDSNLKVTSNIKLHFLNNMVHPHLKVEATIEKIAVVFLMTIGTDGKTAIKEFNIDQLKHMKFHLHGLGPLDPLVDLMADTYVALADTQARQIITGILRPIMEHILIDSKSGEF